MPRCDRSPARRRRAIARDAIISQAAVFAGRAACVTVRPAATEIAPPHDSCLRYRAAARVAARDAAAPEPALADAAAAARRAAELARSLRRGIVRPAVRRAPPARSALLRRQ